MTKSASAWHVWIISFGFMGIQFGWGLQMANMSAIYTMLGAKESELAILWIAAPLTGLLVHPIVGHMSDRTWNRFGRRKPYILFGTLLSSLALLAMPNASALWMAVMLLWVLDGAINVSMQPFRSFVSDMLPKAQRTLGFTVQTVLIGIGAVLSSAMPWILTHFFGVTDDAGAAGHIPASVTWSFYIGALVMVACVLVTVRGTQEQPPEQLPSASHAKGSLWIDLRKGALEILGNLSAMPQRMRQLAWVQLFTWAGLFSMWTYFTPTIARNAFHALEANTPEYLQAAEWGGVCFSVYNGVALAAALAFIPLTRRVSARRIHVVSLVLGGAGLLGASFITNPQMLILSMAGIGIAWASILAMPYAMLADALPPGKTGVFMGIFNLFIVIPQVIVALGAGLLLDHVFGGQPHRVLACGAASVLVAALLACRIEGTSSASEAVSAPSH